MNGVVVVSGAVLQVRFQISHLTPGTQIVNKPCSLLSATENRNGDQILRDLHLDAQTRMVLRALRGRRPGTPGSISPHSSLLAAKRYPGPLHSSRL